MLKTNIQLTDQKKGTLLAFTAIMFITPDSLFIRLSTIESWNLIFYRGFIPFFVVFLGLLIIQKGKIITALINNGWHGIAYAVTFAITNILFVISIENTSVANTLIMISLAPMLSAVISLIFLKENPDKKTWIAIIITTLAVIYIFFDSFEKGDMKGNFFGLVCATGLAVGAVIIRSVKQLNLVPSAMMGKLLVAIIALLFADNLNLEGSDLIIIPTMCIMCVAIPFVLVTLAPRYITAAEVNLFFLLETILGPIWVWLIIHEQPSMETIIGGIVIISTITAHSFLTLKKT
jgi:drug/metabolite transporter (DMT)-like permease